MSNLVLTEDHRYLLDNLEIPGVSKILQEAGLSDMSMVKPEILERNSAFGNAVHAVINFKCKGTLDEESVDHILIPYLQGWDNFVEDFGYVCEKSEYQTHHPVYRYGMTCDQIGRITKGKYLGPAVGDIKSGSPFPSHKYQLAGYKICVDKKANTFILYLNPEFKPGGYKVVFAANNKREQGVFLSALTIFNVRREEGLIK